MEKSSEKKKKSKKKEKKSKKKEKKSKKKVGKSKSSTDIAKIGRPQKIEFDDVLLSCITALAEEGKTNDEIASTLGISRDTFYRYQKQIGDFSDALKKGKHIADIMVEQALFTRAIGYTTSEAKPIYENKQVVAYEQVEKNIPPDPTSMIFWLKNRKPDRWRDKKESEVTVNNLHDALSRVLDEENG